MAAFSPSPSWCEPADLDDDTDPSPELPVELLTVGAGIGWWTASLDLDTDD